MEIKTKFNFGDKVWTISQCKAAQFTIGFIGVYDGVIVYGSDKYNLIPESECFATKDKLLKYITGDGD